MTITAEQAAKLLEGARQPLDDLSRNPSRKGQHDLMIAAPDLARALIASEAARKLAEERLAAIVWSYDATHTFRTADMHRYDCKCLRCAVDAARAVLKEIDNG